MLNGDLQNFLSYVTATSVTMPPTGHAVDTGWGWPVGRKNASNGRARALTQTVDTGWGYSPAGS
ncbi:hypothetical protein GCM10010253_66080 [Streptomyces badius]|uniref:Uncharacterized protein n=1 Tax=Streptomyces badius TaxID=1941 RepID=A0ABQ2TRB7_STRBA|nr:hypothetical protein GCM10010253_66080 [Streptomyces badius]